MPTPQKEAIVQEMSEKFTNASSFFMADFTGVDVNTINELRRKFYESNVEYRVVKNTLAKLSLKNAGIDGLDDMLKGVNSYAISYDDPTVPIKIVKSFKKELDGKFAIKAAYFDGEIVSEDVEALSELPSKDELIAKFMSMIQSPMTKLAATLNAPMSGMVGVLKSLEETKK